MLYVYRNLCVTLCSLLWGVLYVPWIIHTVEYQLLGKVMCVLFHMVHTQSIRFIIVAICYYLERVKRSLSVVGNMNTTIFVPEKIEKWTRELNYHEESTQDKELVAIYNLASLVAKFRIFFG